MGLKTPRLDDRAFTDIVAEALQRIPLYTPEWTDHNLSDPGITLIELFAWMSDIILYRLNRVPDKHFIKFMELVGMRLREAEPARAPVTFWLASPQEQAVVIPSATEVATTRTETDPSITFSTDFEATIQVPTLRHVLTRPSAGGQFRSHNLTALAKGFEGLNVFESQPPTTGDTVYLGFAENLSQHLIGIDMEVDKAEGAGIDPDNPPYVWEVLGRGEDTPWVPCDVDYDGTKGFNVSGLVRLHLPQMQEGERDGKVAYWVRCRLAPQESIGAYEISPRVQRLVAQSWGITIPTTSVTTVHDEVMGRSDGSPGQRFYLEHTPIVPRLPRERLLVRMEDGTEEYWTEVSDFSDSDKDSPHYTLDSQTGELRLGPALPQRDGSIFRYGKVPPRNAMLVMRAYRYGGGMAGNVGKNTLNILKTSLSQVDRVANREAAKGGRDGEDLEDAKVRLPGYMRTLRRAVTAEDFEYLAEEAAPGDTGRVYCLQPPYTQAGEVKVLVIPAVANPAVYIPPENLVLSDDVRERIQTYLDERRLLSTKMEVTTPTYHWVQTMVRFRASRFENADEVRDRVRDRLFAFLNPLTGGQDGTGWPFGRDLFASDIMAALLTVPGVDFVRSVRLFPIVYQDGQFSRIDEVSEIALSAQGVVASYEHDVREE
ncbi:MAG: putative baseplate assembly protein [Anaerolineaceae bacterium]|nr:putative baseplate assembly protein [Anaerolineaceae bacterium]